MTEQLKPRKRVLDFIADAFDEFFGGQELHRARNALMPPPPPKEQPMNLDDYIFNCPTCYDSQQVRVPALHGYKPCPDCTMPEPPRCRAPKRETPTPFDEITPEMLKALQVHEHRCPQCHESKTCSDSCTSEADQSEWSEGRKTLLRGAVVACDECKTVSQSEPEDHFDGPCFWCEGFQFDGDKCLECGRVHVVGTPLSQPEPPPTGNGELVTPSLLAALADHPDLHAMVTARDAFGRAKYGTGLRIDNGRDALEDAHQELGDLLQYLWQAKMEGRDITHALDQMARAISVLQGGK